MSIVTVGCSFLESYERKDDDVDQPVSQVQFSGSVSALKEDTDLETDKDVLHYNPQWSYSGNTDFSMSFIKRICE